MTSAYCAGLLVDVEHYQFYDSHPIMYIESCKHAYFHHILPFIIIYMLHVSIRS